MSHQGVLRDTYQQGRAILMHWLANYPSVAMSYASLSTDWQDSVNATAREIETKAGAYPLQQWGPILSLAPENTSELCHCSAAETLRFLSSLALCHMAALFPYKVTLPCSPCQQSPSSLWIMSSGMTKQRSSFSLPPYHSEMLVLIVNF